MIVLKWMAVVVIGYLLGNIEWGLIISRVLKTDIRQHGSGNTGATNLTRTLGALPGLLTLIGDVSKGIAATLIGMALLGRYGAMVGGICAVIGHNWPVFFKFKGGKGVAATLGSALIVQPLVTAPAALVGIVLIAVTRYVSLSVLIAVSLFVVLALILFFGDWALFAYVCVLSAMIFYVHRGNIERLRQRRENKLTFGRR